MKIKRAVKGGRDNTDGRRAGWPGWAGSPVSAPTARLLAVCQVTLGHQHLSAIVQHTQKASPSSHARTHTHAQRPRL